MLADTCQPAESASEHFTDAHVGHFSTHTATPRCSRTLATAYHSAQALPSASSVITSSGLSAQQSPEPAGCPSTTLLFTSLRDRSGRFPSLSWSYLVGIWWAFGGFRNLGLHLFYRFLHWFTTTNPDQSCSAPPCRTSRTRLCCSPP